MWCHWKYNYFASTTAHVDFPSCMQIPMPFDPTSLILKAACRVTFFDYGVFSKLPILHAVFQSDITGFEEQQA
jgi:hypothetical protein